MKEVQMFGSVFPTRDLETFVDKHGSLNVKVFIEEFLYI